MSCASALASLALFAPFLRRVFLVTDEQTPSFLSDAVSARHPWLRDRVSVVDHREIFPDARHLPTFNSIAIEAAMHRIPGLAEHFVYLNDDFFLGRPLDPSHWFKEGEPVLRGRFRPYYEDRWSYRIKMLLDLRRRRRARPGFITSQQRAARIAWSERRFLQIGHEPHPLRRSTIAEFYAARPDVFERQLRHRFRHPEQVSTVSLANHAELAGGTARLEPPEQVGYLKPSTVSPATVEAFAERASRAGRFASACIQSMDEFAPPMRERLLEILEARYFAAPAEVFGVAADRRVSTRRAPGA